MAAGLWPSAASSKRFLPDRLRPLRPYPIKRVTCGRGGLLGNFPKWAKTIPALKSGFHGADWTPGRPTRLRSILARVMAILRRGVASADGEPVLVLAHHTPVEWSGESSLELPIAQTQQTFEWAGRTCRRRSAQIPKPPFIGAWTCSTFASPPHLLQLLSGARPARILTLAACRRTSCVDV